MTAYGKVELCHRCGRAITLNSAGRFPRHNRGAMMDDRHGHKIIQVIRGARCSGSKLTPAQSKQWIPGRNSGCQCESADVTWRKGNVLEQQFALWGQHSAPAAPSKPYTVTVDGEEVHVDDVNSSAVDVTVVWEGSIECEIQDLRRALSVIEKDIADRRDTASRLEALIRERERRSE